MSFFVRLCETASPTGSEGEVAGLVRDELRTLGIEVTEDDAAVPAGAGAGNLLARLPGRTDRWTAFCAHLDTVPHEQPIEVFLDDEEVYRSAGPTILGADNKAAVAVLVELARRHVADPPEVGIELIFTVAEEQGLLGAREFDCSRLESERIYVLDYASPIGEVVVHSPTYHRIEATFIGVEAHAGIAPEQGRSAIRAAADAISAMSLGRVDEETTVNVGVIEGGTSNNVVPGACSVTAEVRSLDPERAASVVGGIAETMTSVAAASGCEVDFDSSIVFRGYEVPEDSLALAVAERGLAASGNEPSRVGAGGGSDANVFRERGVDALLLANGTFDNHTSTESVPRANLSAMLEVCELIVAEEARC